MAYAERAAAVPGAVVWRNVAGGEPGRVLPDGCMDLLWLGDRLVVAGPDTHAYVHATATGTELVGVRLAPGWGPALVGVPADAVRDQRVDLDRLWPSGDVRRLTDRIAGATDKGRLLEQVALERLAASPPDPVVVDVAGRLDRGAPIDDVAAAVGLSPRHLRRVAHAAFGYGPKLLVRILRLQRALAEVGRGVPPADVAAASYADQAHLARDVRDLTGTTLRALMPAQRSG